MKLLEKIGSGVMKRVGPAIALMEGFLAFAGAGTASALRAWWLACALADQ